MNHDNLDNKQINGIRNVWNKPVPPLFFDGILLFFLAWIIRLFVLAIDPMISRDGVNYLNMIQCWYNGGNYEGLKEQFNVIFAGVSSRIPPLHLFLSVELMRFGLSNYHATILLNLFFGCSLPFVGYRMAHVVFRQRWKALVTGLFITIHPFLIHVSIQPQREAGYLFFSGIAILFALYAIIKHHTRGWAVCGLSIALATLIRVEAMELLILILLYFVIELIQKEAQLLDIIRKLILVVIPFIAMFFLMNNIMGRSWQTIYNGYQSYYYNEKSKLPINSIDDDHPNTPPF